MRWSAFVDCPKPSCDGRIEVWLEEVVEKPRLHAVWLYCCSECNLRGNWEMFARQHGGKRREYD